MIEYKVIDYTIPLYGNKHIFPYGKIKMQDGEYKRICGFEVGERFTFNRKAYKVINIGSIYAPKFNLKQCD